MPVAFMAVVSTVPWRQICVRIVCPVLNILAVALALPISASSASLFYFVSHAQTPFFQTLVFPFAAPLCFASGVDPQATGNGLSWQSNNDSSARKDIRSKIVAYLNQRGADVRPEWIQKVRFCCLVFRASPCVYIVRLLPER